MQNALLPEIPRFEEKCNIGITTFCNDIKYATIQITWAIIRFDLNMIIPRFALTLNVAISRYVLNIGFKIDFIHKSNRYNLILTAKSNSSQFFPIEIDL